MKKIVIYTQRVEYIESYQERRDCADQNIPAFLAACGYLPVPVPNMPRGLADFAGAVRPAGILLTGGNSLVKYGGDAPERDAVDRGLIELALHRDIPVYGFCRGMQSLLDYFGAQLETVRGHVAVRHTVTGEWGELKVNSYHNQACMCLKEPLQAMAWADDGVIEAVAYPQKRLIGTMWHPEREKPFSKADIDRVRALFGNSEGEG